MLRTLRFLIRLVLHLIAQTEIRGDEHIPPTGGVIIAANHVGILDVIMVYIVIDRTDLFIPVAEKWGRVGWIHWIGEQLHFVFVDRFNPDLKALRKMIALMEAGNCLIIAPEGTRSPNGALIEGRPGVAYLAARSGFPVIPAAITGTEDKTILSNIKRLHKSTITLTGGNPLIIPPLPNRDRDMALKRHTDEIMCQIASLLPEDYRGFYRDFPRVRELLEERAGQPARSAHA